MSVFMQPIFTQTVGPGGVGSMTFNNIPQGYTDLVVEISARTGNANIIQPIFIQVNGSGQPAGTHSATRVLSNGSTVTTSRDFGYTGDFLYAGYMIPDTSATANTFSNARITIRNYASGSFKPIEVEGVAESNVASGTAITTTSAIYLNSKPVTSIYIGMGNWTIAQNSTFTLYGIAQQYATALPSTPTISAVTDQAGFASVAFTPASNDQATAYAVTGSDGLTTYGSFTPIVTPMTVGTATTYTAKAINSLGTSTSGTSSPLTTSNAYSSIATVYASSGTISNAVFTNIPQNYTHLQIRAFARGGSTTFSAGLSFYVQFNYDYAAGDYDFHSLFGDGASAYSGNALSTGTLAAQQAIPDVSATANVFGTVVADVLDYSNFYKYKTVKFMGGNDRNGSGRAVFYSGFWNSLAPVTSMIITTDGSFAQYTHIALYGIA